MMNQAAIAMEPLHQAGLINFPSAEKSPTKSKKEFERDFNCILKQNIFRLSQMPYPTLEEKERAINSYIVNSQSHLSDQLCRFYYTTPSTVTPSLPKSR